MRIIKNLTLALMITAIFAMLSLHYTVPTKAETNTISVGPWTFGDDAFADDATDVLGLNQILFRSPLDADLENFCSEPSNFEECLDIALTDYSPNTFLGNIGGPDPKLNSNWFQLDFIDVKAENHFGPDIVFFDCHYPTEENSFEFSVHPEVGDFTEFLTYDPSDFQETGVICDDPYTIWGVAIDLSSFGLASGTIVDAIQFKSLPEGENDIPQGDPVMAAVLTNPPLNIFLPVVVRK